MKGGGDGGAREPADGVLVVDKPEGMTSFAVVDRVRRWLKTRKAGHCGTLDPFATGVLVLCLNQATRVADQLAGQDKSYRFVVTLGVETDTLDKTGQAIWTYQGPPKTEDQLKEALESFRGSLVQQVPRHSAVKVGGKRLYQLSRKGVEVERPRRPVEIHRLDLLEYRWPRACLQALCSKGTYIRQLASDLGARLGCGGFVSELRRLASGSFTLEDAVSLEELPSLRAEGRWKNKLISLNRALAHLPAVQVEDERVLKLLRDGCLDPRWEASHERDLPTGEGPVRLMAAGDRLVALWWRESKEKKEDRLRRGSRSCQGSGRQRRLRVFR